MRKWMFRAALCAVLLACAAPAMAAKKAQPYLGGQHESVADIVDGKAVYDRLEFSGLYLELNEDNIVATEAYQNAKGTFTITGGRYTFWNGTEDEEVSDPMDVRTFEIAGDNMETGKKGLYYILRDARGRELSFRGAADTGLNGKTVRWEFPEHPELNLSAKVPNCRSTAAHMRDCVPYVELVRSGGNVKEVHWRFVNPKDTSKAVKVKEPYHVRIRIYDHTKDRMAYQGKWQSFKKGAAPQGKETLKTSIPEKDICFVRVQFYSDRMRYAWYFYPCPEDDGGIVDRGELAAPITLKAGETRAVTVKMAEGFNLVPRQKRVLVGDSDILSAETTQTGDTVTLTLTGQKPGRTTVSLTYYHDVREDHHQRMTVPQEVIVTD